MEGDQNTPDRQYFLQGRQVGNKAPEVLRREHERFCKRLSRTLKGSFGLAKNREELEQCIRKAGEQPGGSVNISELAVAEFNGAADQLEAFKEKRTRGVHGAGESFQRSVVAVSRFAAAYSSILEAVSKASGPYTEIGYQTVTILLIVFVNKKKHDDIIEQHLKRIGRLFPRLERWKAIYQNNRMEELVSITYHLGIQFSRSVAEYFCHRWKRVLLAVNPLAMGSKFNDVAQSIYEALAEVNAEANQSLHTRSQNIERLLLDSETSNADLRAELAGVRTELAAVQSELATSRIKLHDKDRQADDENFRILEGGLSPKIPTSSHPCFDLSQAKSTLKKAFPNVKECSSIIPWSLHTLMTPERILLHPSFQKWVDLQSSALIFIHGGTKREGRASTVAMPCWLSPASIHIFEHVTSLQDPETKSDRVVYFSCRPDRENIIDKAASVLTMVALRLLSTRKDILRERLTEFQKLTASNSPVSSRTSSPSLSRPSHSPTWPPSSSSPGPDPWSRSAPTSPAWNDEPNTDVSQDASPMSTLTLKQSRLFLSQVLGELSKRDVQPQEQNKQRGTTAYIILDRVDCIDDNVKLKKFLIELSSLTKEMDSFCVKVVVVAEARLQNKWNENLHEDIVDPDKVFEVKMDQRELTSREMASEKRQVLWKDQPI